MWEYGEGGAGAMWRARLPALALGSGGGGGAWVKVENLTLGRLKGFAKWGKMAKQTAPSGAYRIIAVSCPERNSCVYIYVCVYVTQTETFCV